MSEFPIIVVDTSILFSALLNRDSRISQLLEHGQYRFFICEFTLAELFSHKEKLVKSTRLSAADLTQWYHAILHRVEIFKELTVTRRHWERAVLLCKAIDESDAPHLALALELDAKLWSGDKTLKAHLSKQEFINFFEP